MLFSANFVLVISLLLLGLIVLRGEGSHVLGRTMT